MKSWFIEKFKLVFHMLLAANTAGVAIFLCFKYLMGTDVDYGFCVGSFLIIRVYLFMANKQMPLIDENVAFMSSERTLWNNATILVAALEVGLVSIAVWLIEKLN